MDVTQLIQERVKSPKISFRRRIKPPDNSRVTAASGVVQQCECSGLLWGPMSYQQLAAVGRMP